MKEFALALSAMTASHHWWPMKPPLEPAPIVRPAPVQTLYVDLRELRKAIDRYCREQKHFQQVRSSVQGTDVRSSNRCLVAILCLEVPRSKGEVSENALATVLP